MERIDVGNFLLELKDCLFLTQVYFLKSCVYWWIILQRLFFQAYFILLNNTVAIGLTLRVKEPLFKP